MIRYFYADANNQPVGPYTTDELNQLFLAGNLRADTWVVEEGGTQWQPYSNLVTTKAPIGSAFPPQAAPPSMSPTQPAAILADSVSTGTALIWFLCCFPIGYMRWGQTMKGWVWLVISIVTGGVGGLVALVDYWMCFSAQQKRKLGEWDFFPR